MRQLRIQATWITLVLVAALGCRSHDAIHWDEAASYLPYVQDIEYTDVEELASPPDMGSEAAPPTVRNIGELDQWSLTLQDAMRIALQNSQVIRRLGGRVIDNPQIASTIYDPAIQEADPRSGVEAALSAFDANLSTRLFMEQQDRAFNNAFIGAGQNVLLSNLSDFRAAVDKTAATGTQFSFENLTNYNRNGSPVNAFGSAYDTLFTAGFRHPLLQGSGVEFNRIAGPNATPGNYNGVLLARIQSDVSLATFERAVRDLLRDVEQTYWELYFAYRDLDSAKVGRQLALESWKLEKRRAEGGTQTPAQEAFARDQFYGAQVLVENALSGRADGTGGVYAVEGQLRRLLGLPMTDGRIIVTADEPAIVDVRFDWQESLSLALTRRVELRSQQWTIKRRELEWIAAQNFQKMRLDFIGQYRWRGFGDDLFGNSSGALLPDPNNPGMFVNPGFGSAFGELFDGGLQDWRLGLELSTPIGNRLGYTAARQAHLQLMRETAIYEEMQEDVAAELRASYTELDRAYAVTRSQYNRRVATIIRLQAERQRNVGGRTRLDLVLDAQRQFVDAERSYYRALIDYNLALVNMHYSRGMLLDHLGIRLSEGSWTEDAHRTASRLARRFRHTHMGYKYDDPGPVSLGEYPQIIDEPTPEPLPEFGEPTPLPPQPPLLNNIPVP